MGRIPVGPSDVVEPEATANERKHGVSFDETKDVFLDLLAETFNDPDHSSSRSRDRTRLRFSTR